MHEQLREDSCRMRGKGAIWKEHCLWNMEFKCQYGILKWENMGVGFRKVVSWRNKKISVLGKWHSTVSCQPGKLRKQGRERQRLWTLEGVKENSEKYQGGSSRSRPELKPLLLGNNCYGANTFRSSGMWVCSPWLGEWTLRVWWGTGAGTAQGFGNLVTTTRCLSHFCGWMLSSVLQLPITIIITRALSWGY